MLQLRGRSGGAEVGHNARRRVGREGVRGKEHGLNVECGEGAPRSAEP